MKRTPYRVSALCAGLFVILLGSRLIWTVSKTETGWPTVRDQWLDAVAGIFGRELDRVSNRAPGEQARFWLAETRRIRDLGDDPDLAEGAAWVLHSPDIGYHRGQLRRRPLSPGLDILIGRIRATDWKSAERAEAEFEGLCRNECVEAVRDATRLQPANPERWRSRAWLIFREFPFSLKPIPRRTHWHAELDECAQHDPSNALYDYLAATKYWTESAGVHMVTRGDATRAVRTLEIKVPATYDLAARRFASGQAKGALMRGTGGYAATLRLLEKSPVSPLERLQIAESRQYRGPSSLLEVPQRWLEAAIEDDRARGNRNSAQQRCRELLRLEDQVTRTGNEPFTYHPYTSELRRTALTKLIELAGDNPGIEHPNDFTVLDQEVRAANEDVKLRIQAVERMSIDVERSRAFANRAALLAWATLTELLLLFAIAGGCWLFALVGRKRAGSSPQRMGWRRHVIAWTAGFGGSLLFLGLCPTGVVTPQWQTWIIRGAISLGPAVGVTAFVYLFRRWIGVSWSNLAGVTGACVLFVFLCARPEIIWTSVRGVVVGQSLSKLVALLVIVPVVGGTLMNESLRFWRNKFISPRNRIYATALVLLAACWIVLAGAAIYDRSDDIAPVQNWMPPTNWTFGPDYAVYSVATLRKALDLPDQDVTLALALWASERGLLIAPVFSLTFLAVWYGVRTYRSRRTAIREHVVAHPTRISLCDVAIVTARSATWAAAVALIVYLSVAPGAVNAIERNYQQRMARLRDPTQMWREFDAAVANITADEAASDASPSVP